jgi:hypothetical protein
MRTDPFRGLDRSTRQMLGTDSGGPLSGIPVAERAKPRGIAFSGG